MATKETTGEEPKEESAVPPLDDPMRRHGADPDGIGSAEAAALRVEALRRVRNMPADDQPPGKT